MVYRGKISKNTVRLPIKYSEYWIDSLDPWILPLRIKQPGWGLKPGCGFTYPKSQPVLRWSPRTCGHTENNMLAVLTIMPLESWSVRCRVPQLSWLVFREGNQRHFSCLNLKKLFQSLGLASGGLPVIYLNAPKNVFLLCVFCIYIFQSTEVLVEDWIQVNLPAPIREMSSAEKGPSFRSRKFCGSLDLLQNLTGHGKALPANADAQQSKKVHYGSDGAPGVIRNPNPPSQCRSARSFLRYGRVQRCLLKKTLGWFEPAENRLTLISWANGTWDFLDMLS